MGGKVVLRHVGVDVSAATLHVAVEGRVEVAEFANSVVGFKKLVAYATKGSAREVRFVVEATGTYHLDLALFLHADRRCKVMVANPRQTKHFHEAQGRRAKTDRVDALSLLEFAQRMPFEPWTRPPQASLELRAAARFVDQAIKDLARLKNQLHAATVSESTPDWVVREVQERLAETERLVARGEAKILEMVAVDADLGAAAKRLDTIPGIGPATAARLVAEFAFAAPDMNSKQIAAWAGLDPRARESGSSVRGRRAMSKRGNARVRRMLYMSALAAARKEPFAEMKQRIEERSGKAMIALGAVMRKLLIVSWAVYRSDSTWQPRLASPRDEVSRAA